MSDYVSKILRLDELIPVIKCLEISQSSLIEQVDGISKALLLHFLIFKHFLDEVVIVRPCEEHSRYAASHKGIS